jgi:hypothetical protein
MGLDWLLAAVLSLALGGEMFDVFTIRNDRDCHASNETLLVEQKEGPLQRCKS